MVTPPAFPTCSSTVALASTTRLWLACSTPEKRYLPSLLTDTHTGSAAVSSTRTAAFGFSSGCAAAKAPAGAPAGDAGGGCPAAERSGTLAASAGSGAAIA